MFLSEKPELLKMKLCGSEFQMRCLQELSAESSLSRSFFRVLAEAGLF